MGSRLGSECGRSPAGARGHRRTVGAVLLGMTLLVLPACYWTKYEKLLRTHVQLLLAMADKVESVTLRDGVPPPSLAEYRYPLERARDFARIAARRFEGRASLAAFRLLCDAYERMLVAVERMRGAESPEPRIAFETALTALRIQARAVLAALEGEAARS